MIMTGTIFLVTIEKEKVLPKQSQRQYLTEKTLSLEKYKQGTVRPTGFIGRTLLALQNQSSFQKCLLTKLCKGHLNFPIRFQCCLIDPAGNNTKSETGI